jgi:hypothetical protein
MPMPISIWSSGRSNGRHRARRQRHAHAAAGLVDAAGDRGHPGEVAALVGRGAGQLLHQHGDAHPPAAGRVQAVLHRDVVVRDDRDDLDARVGGGELGGHLEVHDVAGVVLHDVQHTGAAVDATGGLEHLVGHRRGEHLPWAGGVEHAGPDEAAVQRFVPRPTAGQQPDLSLHGRIRPIDDLVFEVDPQIGMRRGHAAQGLGDDVCRIVDQLLHARPSAPMGRSRGPYDSFVSCATSLRRATPGCARTIRSSAGRNAAASAAGSCGPRTSA